MGYNEQEKNNMKKYLFVIAKGFEKSKGATRAMQFDSIAAEKVIMWSKDVRKSSFLLMAAIGLSYLPLSSKCHAATYAYVSNSADDTVSVISTSDNTVINIVEVDNGPWGVAVTPKGESVYVTNSLDDTVSVISTSDNTVTDTIVVGDGPRGVAVTPNGDHVYAANNLEDTVSVISTSDNTVADTIVVGDGPWGVAVTPNGNTVYVTNSLDDTVSVISTSDNTVTGIILVGDGPWGVAVTPNGDTVYVANNSDDTVSVISTSDNGVSATVAVGDSPRGVAVTPDGDTVYVANKLDDTVSVVSTSDNALTETVAAGNGPTGMAVTPNGDRVYVANSVNDTVSVISTSDNTVSNTIKVGNSPAGFGNFIGEKPLQAPSDLVATAVAEDEIRLSWTDNSDDELGFKIERKKDEETFTEIDTTSADVTSYTDTGLSIDTTYYYRVRAYDDADDSGYSNEADATTEEESEHCFIVTAVYGSALERHVNLFGYFRDLFLVSLRAKFGHRTKE